MSFRKVTRGRAGQGGVKNKKSDRQQLTDIPRAMRSTCVCVLCSEWIRG